MIFKSLINSTNNYTHKNEYPYTSYLPEDSNVIDIFKQHYRNGMKLINQHGFNVNSEEKIIACGCFNVLLDDWPIVNYTHHQHLQENVIYFKNASWGGPKLKRSISDNILLYHNLFYCDFYTFMKFTHQYVYPTILKNQERIQLEYCREFENRPIEQQESELIKVLSNAFDLKFNIEKFIYED